MNSKYFYLAIILISNSQIFGQGIFKSSNNNIIQVQSDSIAIDDDKPSQVLNAFNFDTYAKSIDYSFLQPINEKKKNIWLGFSIEGKSNNSIAKIFENGSITPSYKFGANLILNKSFKGKLTKSKIEKREKIVIADDSIQKIFNLLQDSLKRSKTIPLSMDNKIDSLMKYGYKYEVVKELKVLRDSLLDEIKKMTFTYDGIRFGLNSSFEGRGFYNYILNSTFQEELIERRKNIVNLNAFINYYTLKLWKVGPYIGGVSVGYSDIDNFSRLTEVSVTNTWKSEDGGTSRSTAQKLTAFQGNYVDTIKQFKYGIDQYFVPEFLKRKIGISFNFTYNHFPKEEIKNYKDITIGLYIIKDSPFAPLQGIIFSFKDISKQLEIPVSQSRFSIGYTRQLNMYRVLKASTSEDKK